MRTIVFPLMALFLFFPVPGLANEALIRIAVVRGPFVIEDSGFDALEQAEIVRRHASDGIRLDMGYEVVEAEIVDRAAVTVAGSLENGRPRPCTDEACLAAIASLVGATGAVQLSIEKKKDGSYAISVRNAVTPPEINEVDRGMAVVLEVARRLAGGASRRVVETRVVPQAPPPEPEPVVEAETNPDVAVEPEPSLEKKRQRLHKGWFFGSLGLTGALGLTWGIVEGVAWSRIQEAQDNDQLTSADRNELRGWQAGARVLLISSATLAVTTAVLALFTDFKGEQPPQATVAPMISDNTLGLGLSASF